MRANFRQHLDTLRDELLKMAHQVDRSFVDAIEAYRTADSDLSHRVIGAETMINLMEREIDRNAIELLALEQPTAIDLRFILSIMRINSDLERIGDQAAGIARRVNELQTPISTDFGVDIPLLAKHAREMFTLAIQSFKEADADLAESVLKLDDEVDELNAKAFRGLSRYISDHPTQAEEAMDMLIIARGIERVADHATNVAEDTIFWLLGEDVRHNVVGR